jgi:phosphopentomutase
LEETHIRRILWIVLDSVGMGALPDAALYGDAGTSTLVHVLEAVPKLRLPNLARLGLGNIMPLPGVAMEVAPEGCYGRMAELSPAKDSAIGHWELAGVPVEIPFPTYPEGFPPEVIEPFVRATGRNVLGNKTASGTEIIAELGTEHLASGSLIVYTSADSVFQIAAHKDVVPLVQLYEICRQARSLLTGKHGVARVIARPFIGKPGNFSRVNAERRDFTLPPPAKTVLDCAQEAGLPVSAVGKIPDLFGGRGIGAHRHSADNHETLRGIASFLGEQEKGIVMANLVDFDMVYGHRNDAAGYAQALAEFDSALPDLRRLLSTGDACFIVSDHGCDPTTPGTDHTREYALLLVFGPGLRRGVPLGDRASFADSGATVSELLGLDCPIAGTSFADEIITLKH